jgi:prepilin-type N-terminal cleavage/methylation domain-containing protein
LLLWGGLYARHQGIAIRASRRSGFTPDTFIGRNSVGPKARPTSEPGGNKARPTATKLRDPATRGFTLFELLTVIAIVALVSALALGGGQFAIENGRRLRTRTELAALSAALESYKREFGDYPNTASTAEFLQALVGRRTATGAAATSRCRLELDRFHVVENRDPLTDASAELIDPWERSYLYAYKTNAGWTNPSYVLFSTGKDGQCTPVPASGVVDADAAENLDNVYATP